MVRSGRWPCRTRRGAPLRHFKSLTGEKCRDLGLYRLRQKLARAVAQNIGQRIGDIAGLT